jgi:hypothetical protein
MRIGETITWQRVFAEEDIRRFNQISGNQGIHHVAPDEHGRLMVQGLLTATIPTKIGGDMNFIAREMKFQFHRPVFSGVEERETKNDRLVEISRNYFAIDRRTNDVYYFSEDVDIYRRGKVVSHEGGWLAGVNGARFGLMMPGSPDVQQKFYQEVSAGVAMDRAESVSLNETLVTPSGKYEEVLKVVETTPLETGSEAKYYGRGIGLLQDGALKLVKYRK